MLALQHRKYGNFIEAFLHIYRNSCQNCNQKVRNNFCRKCAVVDLSGSRYTGVDEEVGDTVENLASKQKAGPSALIPATSKGDDSLTLF